MVPFNNPDATPPLKNHDGHHPIIQPHLSNSHWPSAQEQVKRCVRRAEMNNQAHLLLSFRCNRGRHRSVAAAEIVSALLRATGRRSHAEHVALDFGTAPRCMHKGCNVFPFTWPRPRG
ncbi:MAG: hypothetical protein ACKPKO_07465 [Candidatus Fonsibacter sp.]